MKVCDAGKSSVRHFINRPRADFVVVLAMMQKEDFFMDPVLFERTINSVEVEQDARSWLEKCMDFLMGECVRPEIQEEEDELFLLFDNNNNTE